MCPMNWLKKLNAIDTSGLVKKANYDAKINAIKCKYLVLLA